MPATRQRGGTNRASARTTSNGSTRGRTAKKPSQSNSKANATQGNAKSAASQASSKTNAARSASNNGNGNHEAVTAVGISLASATLGAVGGVLLGRNALARRRKIPPKIDLSGVGQQIGEAGRQFARLAGEVRSVREKAEQIGRILS